jgi:hypothetical protein
LGALGVPAAPEPAALEPEALEPEALEPAALEPSALEPAALEPAAPPGGVTAAEQPSSRGTVRSANDPIARPKYAMARAFENIE